MRGKMRRKIVRDLFGDSSKENEDDCSSENEQVSASDTKDLITKQVSSKQKDRVEALCKRHKSRGEADPRGLKKQESLEMLCKCRKEQAHEAENKPRNERPDVGLGFLMCAKKKGRPSKWKKGL